MNNIVPWVNYIGNKPQYQTSGSAGCDLQSIVNHTIAPGGRALISTGLRLEMPSGVVGLICPRSGLALKHGITVLNGPGVIDNDFRGEIQVLLVNLSNIEYTVKIGDRIAQLVFCPVFQGHFKRSEELTETNRSSGGFGSTGR